jgi:hypothetical protein
MRTKGRPEKKKMVRSKGQLIPFEDRKCMQKAMKE